MLSEKQLEVLLKAARSMNPYTKGSAAYKAWNKCTREVLTIHTETDYYAGYEDEEAEL